MQDGWQPVPGGWTEGAPLYYTVEPLVENGFGEVESCSGTGLNPCAFEFLGSDGELLIVTTAGESDDPVVQDIRVEEMAYAMDVEQYAAFSALRHVQELYLRPHPADRFGHPPGLQSLEWIRETFEAPDFHPHFREGDFNADGVEDFSVLALTGMDWDEEVLPYVVLIFNGRPGGGYELAGGDAFEKFRQVMFHPRGDSILSLGVAETHECWMYTWGGERYGVELCSDDDE